VADPLWSTSMIAAAFFAVTRRYDFVHAARTSISELLNLPMSMSVCDVPYLVILTVFVDYHKMRRDSDCMETKRKSNVEQLP
jgi:hypothetical protein